MLRAGDRVDRDDRAGSCVAAAPVALIIALGGVLPILVAWRFGALGIPRNDDWSYLIASFRFANGDGIDGNDWALMNLVGQLVIALPVNVLLDNRVAPLQILVASFGAAGIVALYYLASNWLSRQRALFAACLLAVGPLWAALAGSFMTDVPTFSLSMICLAAGAKSLMPGTRSTRWLAAALVAGFAGFAIRQYAMVAIVAVAAAAVWHVETLGRRRLAVTIGFCTTTVAAAAAFYMWRVGLPGFDDPPLKAPTARLADTAIDRSMRAATLVGFLVAPALCLAGPVRTLRASVRRSPTATVVSAVFFVAAFGSWFVSRHGADPAQMISLGNYFGPGGILGADVIKGVRPELVPKSVMAVFAFAGVATVVTLLTACASTIPHVMRSMRPRARDGSPAKSVAVLALVGFGSAVTVPMFVGMPLFDRYLLPVIALASVIVLGSTENPGRLPGLNRWTGGLAFAVVAAVGLVFAVNSASFDGARWRAAERASEFTGNRVRVDGGFEWINYYAGRQVFFSAERTSPRYCVQVVSSPDARPGWNGISEPVWGVGEPQAWIIAEQRGPC